jgi:glycosyltransferase involved in cell wall biosynthesis
MIVFAHLLNDFSGSPQVLKSTIASLNKDCENTLLYVGSDGNGCLTNSAKFIKRYWYKRTRFRFVTLFTYFFSQLLLFSKLLFDKSVSKQAIIYVNTLLPFGAALYGKLTGRKVIYHIHEISLTPYPLKFLLTKISGLTSSLNIYVSDAHMEAMLIKGVTSMRVHNALNIEFSGKATTTEYAHRHQGFFNVLMVSSLKDYKGIPELFKLANSLIDLKNIRFDLVLNEDLPSIERYFDEHLIPVNLTIHPRTNDTFSFYTKTSLVLNLSRVDQWVETFGMTILEAMTLGIPVIVPPIGGPTELVRDGVEGLYVDSRNHEHLRSSLIQLCNNKSLCIDMSQAGRLRAEDFSISQFGEGISLAINHVRDYSNNVSE